MKNNRFVLFKLKELCERKFGHKTTKELFEKQRELLFLRKINKMLNPLVNKVNAKKITFFERAKLVIPP